jgi:WD40 repeat protein
VPILATCACGKQLRLKEELAGKKIRCPACQATLAVPTAALRAEDAVSTKRTEAQPVPEAAPRRKVTQRPVQEVDEEAEPRPRRRDDEEGPKSGGSAVVWIALAGGGLALVLLLGLAVGGYFLFLAGKAETKTVDTASKGGTAKTASTDLLKRDPQQDAEAAAQRDKRILELQGQDKKIVEALKTYPRASPGKKPLLVVASFDYTWGFAGFSPDGSLLALRGWKDQTGEYLIFSLANGKLVSRFPSGKEAQLQTAFSPDGTLFAVGGFDDQITIRDVASGEVKKTFPFGKHIWYLSFTPDGKHLLASLQGKLALVDRETGQVAQSFGDYKMNASHPVISPSGKIVASVVGTYNKHVALFDAATGQKITEREESKSISDLIMFPDGWKLLLRTSDDVLLLWDFAANKTEELGKGATLSYPALSPDGKYLALRDDKKGLLLVDVASGKEISTVPGVIGTRNFSSGGLLLYTFDNAQLRVWSVPDLLGQGTDSPKDK